MAIFSITKTQKPRQFQYIPRYYDARAERLAAIVRRAQQEAALEANGGDPPLGESQREANLRLSFEEARFVRSSRRVRMRMRMAVGLVLLALSVIVYLWL